MLLRLHTQQACSHLLLKLELIDHSDSEHRPEHSMLLGQRQLHLSRAVGQKAPARSHLSAQQKPCPLTTHTRGSGWHPSCSSKESSPVSLALPFQACCCFWWQHSGAMVFLSRRPLPAANAPPVQPTPVCIHIHNQCIPCACLELVLQESRCRNAVIAAAQAGRAAGQPRFGQTSGPNGFRTLPVIKFPMGSSPNDPSTPLEVQMEVLTPEGGGLGGGG